MSELIKFPERRPRKPVEGPSGVLLQALHLRKVGFDYFALNVSGQNRFVQVHVSGKMLRSANEGLTC